ncbi:MAG: hypothetical protein RMM17_03865 [Acidobacteriota bacterium]|nr:hypothetical protein [Blastocatellia bacterium]MDW8411804.1 hypothetical protein [Acidobacteriota bacterium]
MKRILLVTSLLIASTVCSAYTVVLKDGRRMEVRPQYRIVGELVVFSRPDGSRFSVQLSSVNIEETELANGLQPGDFIKNVTAPPKIGEPAQSRQDEGPFVGRVTKKKLTNADFEPYKQRRLEVEKEIQKRELARMNSDPSYLPRSAQYDSTASYERFKEQEKAREDYWRGRTRELLTQLQVVEDQIAIVSTQLEQAHITNISPPIRSVYTPPTLGISIGSIPIWLGSRRWGILGGNSTIVINNQQPAISGQVRALSLQERLTELLLRRQELLVQYDILLEEGRKAGALPGWLR